MLDIASREWSASARDANIRRTPLFSATMLASSDHDLRYLRDPEYVTIEPDAPTVSEISSLLRGGRRASFAVLCELLDAHRRERRWLFLRRTQRGVVQAGHSLRTLLPVRGIHCV